MFPLADDSRRPSRLPMATIGIIVVNVLVFLLELAGGDAFINRWSLVPADIVAGRGWITILTAMFMHAGWAHIGGNPASTVPNLGASGAIAAVMGAFLITYPNDRIRTVIFFGYFVRVALIPAVVLVGVWFLTQLFSEVGALAQVQSGGVAYMAHVGGFLFGVVTARLFERQG